MTQLTLGDLLDCDGVAMRLRARGLSDDGVTRQAASFHRLAQSLIDSGQRRSVGVDAVFVPGRIEILGKHTDYAGGRSLVIAVEHGFCIASVARPDRTVAVTDVATGQATQFILDSELQPVLGDWSNYPMTVARRIARNFSGDLCGADIVFHSDLPRAAGMSSSSALMIATFMALASANRLGNRPEFKANIHNREDLAGYLATTENGMSFRDLTGDAGVGTFGGSEDHTAILCARSGRISQYAYCPVRLERYIELPKDQVFIVGVSGVVAEKTRDARRKYNRLSELARTAAALWRESTGRDEPHLAAILASSPNAGSRFRSVLDAHSDAAARKELLNRVDHFEIESESIIPSVPDAITADSMHTFGSLVDRSQQAGADLLRNQVPQTIELARCARELGATAASAFGAGFGGSVWAMVEVNRSKLFVNEWAKAYALAFPDVSKNAEFFATRGGPAAFPLDAECLC